jgi:Mn-dependent DtxR family transcriptional regulator
MIDLPKVHIPQRGWHDVFEVMLAHAMNVTPKSVKNYVKETQDNQFTG